MRKLDGAAEGTSLLAIKSHININKVRSLFYAFNDYTYICGYLELQDRLRSLWRTSYI